MRIAHSVTTHVPPDKARAWFFDVGVDDHASPEFVEAWGEPHPKDERTILSRTEDAVEVHDVAMGGRMEMRSTTRLVGEDAIETVSEGKGMSASWGLTFVPVGEGTRIDMGGEMRPQGFMRILAFLLGPKMRKKFRQDLALHTQQMEREWAEEMW